MADDLGPTTQRGKTEPDTSELNAAIQVLCIIRLIRRIEQKYLPNKSTDVIRF